MKLQYLLENDSQHSAIANLQRDTVIKVFHGTDMGGAFDFCQEGIDARKRTYRKYPHFIRRPGGEAPEMISRGLFVTAQLRTGLDFGNAVIEFPATGKDLHYQFPSPDTVRQARKLGMTKYPDSFKPEVSFNLLEPSVEPQALFRGLVSPKAIERVYLSAYDKEGNWEHPRIGEYRAVFTRDEYIDWFLEFGQRGGKQYQKRYREDPIVEPQEKVGAIEVLRRAGERFGTKFKKIEAEEIMSIVKDHMGQAKTYEQQIGSLTELFRISYSAAKRLAPEFLKLGGIKRAPNTWEVQRYWG